jgi:L-threonylcarbamoyladenylate synthase
MLARLYDPTLKNLRYLAGALGRGELVAIPTETVYGLAAHALDAKACRAIFRAKGRPANDPLIVHVLDLAHAEKLAEFNPAARRLVRRFWPGPLTLVLPKKACVPDIVTSGGPTVAIRSPAHPLARRLLRLAGIPLAAPSANLFGYISPTEAAHVIDGLGRKIKHVLDGGHCAVGVESTIIDLTVPDRPRLLRPGSITGKVLAKFLGHQMRPVGRTRKSTAPLAAPGLMARHYSPRTPLFIQAPGRRLPADCAGIFLRQPAGRTGPNIYWLSKNGAMTEIARNLYRVLREADQAGWRQIRVEALPVESGGLVAALRDRLKRAAAKH